MVEHLSNAPGYSHNLASDKRIQPGNLYVRILSYRIWDGITARRAYVEDFSPIIDALKNLEPFLVLNPSSSKLISPYEFKYSMEEWFHKNSVEDARNFKF